MGDLGQIVALAIFLMVWVADSFLLKFSNQFSSFAPMYLRIPLAIIIFIAGGCLAKRGLTVIFAEVRETTVVIRKDVFSIVRHPIYLGAILFYLSLLVLFFSIAATLIWFFIILFYIFLCKHEEILLLKKYGKDYEKYMSETPMLLPKRIGIRK